MLFTILIGSIVSGMFYYRKFLKRKYDKFFQLVRNYRMEEPQTYYITSLYKSVRLVIKCACIDTYHHFTSIKLSNYVFIKHVHGGALHLSIIPISNGPKPDIEYAYIDGVRNDEFVCYMYGINKNFSNCPESLLEFGNCVRYKIYDQAEVILNDGNENVEKNKKKSENLKKIKKLLWFAS